VHQTCFFLKFPTGSCEKSFTFFRSSCSRNNRCKLLILSLIELATRLQKKYCVLFNMSAIEYKLGEERAEENYLDYTNLRVSL